MTPQFIDFHTHSTLSDGSDSPKQLIEKAIQAGIRVLAITDHNTLTPDLPILQKSHPEIKLISGCEVSCIYKTMDLEKELHVIALNCDPQHPKFQSILARNNQFDRAIYVNKILDRLRSCNIDLGTYKSLVKLYPDTHHLGRKHIAAEMLKRGYVNSINEAFDLYIGAFGERRAYVQNAPVYVSLEDAVDAIISSGGIAILAHLFYYRLTSAQNNNLVKYFKQLTGCRGGLEVFYAGYSNAQTNTLIQLASEFGLLPSAASDYHGTENETLEHHFPLEIYQQMKEMFR